jgi:hypothetical protein
MTEAEWLACDKPELMLKHLRSGVSDRKRRLFACACCRKVWRLLPDGYSRAGLEDAERFADGKIGRERMVIVHELTLPASAYQGVDAATSAAFSAYATTNLSAGSAALHAARHTADAGSEADLANPGGAYSDQRRNQAILLREIVGNPFRPVALDAAWQTPTVASLAQAAYDERLLPSGELEPVRLAVLSDALEEAGASSELLGHLRSPGPHVRGCWALDLILGKG